jgi:ABC-type polysaccharide/polyol phosphate export permease
MSGLVRAQQQNRDTDSVSLYDSAVRRAPLRGALVDLYRYRALVRLLVARDMTVRYKRSLLGVTWTVLNPLLITLVMWGVFEHLFHSSIPGHIPYIVYILAGNLVVTYFQQGVNMTAAFSAAASGAVNFVYGLVPLVVIQLSTGTGVAPTFVLVPVPLLFFLLMIAGIGFFLATYAIRYDDVLNLIGVVMVLVAYITPTFYPVTIVPAQFRRFFYLDPVFPYVETFRYLEYGGPRPSWVAAAYILVSGLVGFAVGLRVFVRRWPSLAVLM